MRYFKIVADRYIIAVGIGVMGIEISKDEYEHIQNMIADCPIPNRGYGHRLTDYFKWEEYALPDTIELPTENDYQSALSEFGVKV